MSTTTIPGALMAQPLITPIGSLPPSPRKSLASARAGRGQRALLAAASRARDSLRRRVSRPARRLARSSSAATCGSIVETRRSRRPAGTPQSGLVGQPRIVAVNVDEFEAALDCETLGLEQRGRRPVIRDKPVTWIVPHRPDAQEYILPEYQ
jgi:hypothetical protein